MSRHADRDLAARPLLLTPRLLRRWPLPQPAAADDKEERGRVLVIGGARMMPGAVILAATAALRAGAGKLQIATGASIAQHVATAVPEALVVPLPETDAGGIAPEGAETLVGYAKGVQALLVGPGMVEDDGVNRLLGAVLPAVAGVTVVLDAAPLASLRTNQGLLRPLDRNVVLTPHAGEMATMLDIAKAEVVHGPRAAAERAARTFGAVVALKGAETLIANGEAVYANRSGNVGLATSGSGDTLSGIIAGLAARGAPAVQAAAWGVYLHGRAGDRLAKRVGRLGFLARELLAEIPPLMAAHSSVAATRRRSRC